MSSSVTSPWVVAFCSEKKRDSMCISNLCMHLLSVSCIFLDMKVYFISEAVCLFLFRLSLFACCYFTGASLEYLMILCCFVPVWCKYAVLFHFFTMAASFFQRPAVCFGSLHPVCCKRIADIKTKGKKLLVPLIFCKWVLQVQVLEVWAMSFHGYVGTSGVALSGAGQALGWQMPGSIDTSLGLLSGANTVNNLAFCGPNVLL